MRKSILVLLVSIMSFSCTGDKKDVKSQKGIVQVKEVKKANQLIFEIVLKTDKPDNFVLSSNDIFLSNKQSMNIRITQKLQTSEEFQKIRFEFPENVVPDVDLIFSLGNSVEKEITIQSLLFEFGETQYNIEPIDLGKYFGLNKFVEYNSEKGTLIIKKVDKKLNPVMRLKQKYLLEFSQE